MGDMAIDGIVKRLEALEREVGELKGQKQVQTQSEESLVQSDSFFPGQDAGIDQGLAKIQEGFRALLNAGYLSLTTSIGMFRWADGGSKGWICSSKHKSIDDVPDDGVEQVLEPFTNPRRIKVLKALYDKKLTGSELSQKTGLVGGQLYHHLGVLEEAKLISKDKEAYVLTLKGAKVLFMLTAIAGEMWVCAKNDME